MLMAFILKKKIKIISGIDNNLEKQEKDKKDKNTKK